MTIAPPQETELGQEEARMRGVIGEILELDGDDFEEAAAEFVEDRLEELAQKAVPTSISGLSEPYPGFIHPDTEIFPRVKGTGFKLDDPEVYKDLLDSMKKIRETGKFASLGEEKRYRNDALFALQYYVQTYFAPTGTREERHQLREELMSAGEFLLDDDEEEPDTEAYSIRDIRSVGACAEKASFAQNCLAFLGFDSLYVIGELTIGDRPRELHAFNLVADSSGEWAIYDPTNPKIFVSEDGQRKTAKPAFYRGGNELLEGREIEADHVDMVIDQESGERVSRNTPYRFSGSLF